MKLRNKCMVGIPTMDIDRALCLRDVLVNSEVKPDYIRIIDNGSSILYRKKIDSTIIVSLGRNVGVNPSLNYFMNAAKLMNANITLLNDDIKIKPDFFKKIVNVLLKWETVHIFCPNTSLNFKFFENANAPSESDLIPLTKRECWAITFRNTIVNRMPDIPDELKIFCGDDWYWWHSIRNHVQWFKDMNNIIYHKVGGTLKKHPELRSLLKSEKRKWNKIRKGLES